MVGSMNVYKGTPRQRGRGIGALATAVARSAIPFLARYVAPFAKSVGKNLLEAAIPEVLSVVDGQQNFKQAAKATGRKTIKKQLGRGIGKRTTSSTSRRRRTATVTSIGRITKKYTTKKPVTTKKGRSRISRKNLFAKLK